LNPSRRKISRKLPKGWEWKFILSPQKVKEIFNLLTADLGIIPKEEPKHWYASAIYPLVGSNKVRETIGRAETKDKAIWLAKENIKSGKWIEREIED